MSEPTDQELISRCLAGDRGAFDILALRYQDRLVHSLEHLLNSRDDALDVVQQTLVLAWRKLSSFRNESSFYAWLYRIARNVSISRIRRHRIRAGSLDTMREAADFQPTDQRADSAPERALDQAEQVQLVKVALAKVAEEFRQPLVLKELDGFSYEEIAGLLDIPLGTVRSRIFRGRQELLEHLKRATKD